MSFLDSLFGFIYPTRCPCCAKLNISSLPCESCEMELEECRFVGKVCKKCGNEKEYCECSKYNYLFSGTVAPFKNLGVARDGVYGLKFCNRPYAADYFGTEMAKRFKCVFPNVKPDFICIVPSYRKLLSKRDYDYVLLLAKSVSKELGVPLKHKMLKKIKQTEKQHKLTYEQRKSNIKGVFKATVSLNGETVLLIDDIKTTGYTLNECAKQLRLAGAQSVYTATALLTLNNACKTVETKI